MTCSAHQPSSARQHEGAGRARGEHKRRPFPEALYIVIIMWYLLTCSYSADFTVVWQVQSTTRDLNISEFWGEALITTNWWRKWRFHRKNISLMLSISAKISVHLLTCPLPSGWLTSATGSDARKLGLCRTQLFCCRGLFIIHLTRKTACTPTAQLSSSNKA